MIGWDPNENKVVRWQFRKGERPRVGTWNRNAFLPANGVGAPHRFGRGNSENERINLATGGAAPESLTPLVGNWTAPSENRHARRLDVRPIGIGVLVQVFRSADDVPNMLVFITDVETKSAWLFADDGNVFQSKWEHAPDSNEWKLKPADNSSKEPTEFLSINVVGDSLKLNVHGQEDETVRFTRDARR